MIAVRREHGFTMVELLVVLLVVGVLTGIAVPLFLGQREKAQRAALVADLRGVQHAQQSRAIDGDPRYTDDLADLRAQGYAQSSGVGPAHVEVFEVEGDKEYVACVKHVSVDDWLVYNSLTGVTTYSPTECEAP